MFFGEIDLTLSTKKKSPPCTAIAHETAARQSESDRHGCGSHPLRPADEGRCLNGLQ
jgi:hypothetical protein